MHLDGAEHRQSPLGPVDPSFRALSGRVKFVVRRHKFNKDSPPQGIKRTWVWSGEYMDLGRQLLGTLAFRGARHFLPLFRRLQSSHVNQFA